MFRVSAVNELTDDVVEAIWRLLPQLSSTARALERSELEEIVSSSATTLLVARDEEAEAGAADAENPHGPVVGMLSLVTFRIPTGVRAWIEDAVVDTSERGRGIGEALTQAALELAAARGAKTVDLTSRPSREAANRLYRRMGFELRDTNVYRRRLAT
jgi:ribosomal protein S18 acetylase RimI-like enzyme